MDDLMTRLALARTRGVRLERLDLQPQLIPVSRGGAVEWGVMKRHKCDMTGCEYLATRRGLCLDHWRTHQHRHTD